MNFRKILILILSIFLFSSFSFALENSEGDGYTKIIEKKLSNNKNVKNIKVGEEIELNLSNIEKSLLEKYNSKIEFEWSLKGNTSVKGPIFKYIFKEFGEKEINLNIYRYENSEKKFIINKKFNVYVYKTKMPVIFDSSIGEERIKNYIKKSVDFGVYVTKEFIIDLEKYNKTSILDGITSKYELNGKKGNYITVWGSKDFIFTIISKINKELLISGNKENINLVLVSPFSTDVLNNYLRNFLSNKKWILNIILIPESSLSQLRLNSNNISNLEKSLNSREYENLKVNTNEKISNILFVSKFINTLSNNGFGTNAIYLIIIIPFLFTGISVFKHFIGLSPIGTIIPIFITLLLFIIGIIPTLVILIILVLFNLIISKAVNKYTLLYTPKISFIIILNLAILMLSINLFYDFNLINFNISDVVYLVLFVVIAERLITLIISKEFTEYKYNLLNTFIFALIGYGLLSISLIHTLILAYPEIILILVPLNFMIGRFTGLRITEYFRFREVIKNIEE